MNCLRRLTPLLSRTTTALCPLSSAIASRPVLLTTAKTSTKSLLNRQYRRWTSSSSSSPVLSTRSDDEAVYIDWNAAYANHIGLFDNNITSSYSHVWLRDNCPCEACVHPSSRQKLHSMADIDLNTTPRSIHLDTSTDTLVIEWEQPLRHQQQHEGGHKSHYPLAYLRRYASQQSSQEFRFENLIPRTWARDEYQLEWISHDDYMTTEQGLHRVVEKLYNDGLVFLEGVPADDHQSVTRVAERIGNIQETFYGRDFDVKNVAKSVNIAYTSLYLGFHMDLMYLDCPPGIQLLHCMKNNVTGGASIFLDSYRAVELLKQQYPECYDILRKTPVSFHYINNGHHMYYRRPTIVTDEGYGLGSSWNMHVNYAPQFQGPMDELTPKEMKRFYQAFQRFADFIEDESLRYQITLQPGQLVLFANRRVLHGRTAFDPASGDRHLKGTYLALDSLKDKVRTLGAKYGMNPV
ncbi:uncharacterized protein BX664DRAFT_335195 [Halteromyces radiatus]|uniref:uncharacterized protein n=1 Tax=Halteromyces radiatus TaxID=101107 RepID=UPI0022203CF8|nr:uncharacterized protein BX664DRAFT_335195 [Halteromyces radiatus]KAI8086216.1 hypothetical protein BX664DRAFT_335195 [Halteromyces radiatus]